MASTVRTVGFLVPIGTFKACMFVVDFQGIVTRQVIGQVKGRIGERGVTGLPSACMTLEIHDLNGVNGRVLFPDFCGEFSHPLIGFKREVVGVV